MEIRRLLATYSGPTGNNACRSLKILNMSNYAIVMPAVCVAAIGDFAPQGVKHEDAARKLENVIKAELGKIQFAEGGKSKGPKRLKFGKELASYQTKMEGKHMEVATKAKDAYNWLWDVAEFQKAHGEESLALVNVPKELHDWVKGLVENMKPSMSTSAELVTA